MTEIDYLKIVDELDRKKYKEFCDGHNILMCDISSAKLYLKTPQGIVDMLKWCNIYGEGVAVRDYGGPCYFTIVRGYILLTNGRRESIKNFGNINWSIPVELIKACQYIMQAKEE